MKNVQILYAAAAKSLQSCLTLRDPMDGSPPGSHLPRILQARTLEWAAISFSSAWKWKVKVMLLCCIRLFATPLTAAYQAPPSMGFSKQEYWSGVPYRYCILRYIYIYVYVHIYVYVYICILNHFSHAWLSHWMSFHDLLQGIFLTQGSKLGLNFPGSKLPDPGILCVLHWQASSLPLAPPRKTIQIHTCNNTSSIKAMHEKGI